MSEKEEFPVVDIKSYLMDVRRWQLDSALLKLTGMDSIEEAPFPGFDKDRTLTQAEVVGAHLIMQPTFFEQLGEMRLEELDQFALQYIAEAFYKVMGAGGWLVVGPAMVGHLNMLQIINSFYRDWRFGKLSIPGIEKFNESVPASKPDVYSDAQDLFNLGVRIEACTFGPKNAASHAVILYGDGVVKVDDHRAPGIIMGHLSEPDRTRFHENMVTYKKTASQLYSSLFSFIKQLQGQSPLQAMTPLTLYEEFIHYVGNYARGAVGMGRGFGQEDSTNLKRSAEHLLELLNGQRQRRKKLTEEVNRQAPTAEGQPAPKGDEPES